MENILKPLIFIGSGRSGTTIISEIVFRHEELAWPSNYQERFPTLPSINLLRNLFENKLWHLQGQKRQLNKVSAFNKFLFKPAEAYTFWEYLTGPSINFSKGFLINDHATEIDIIKIHSAFNKLVNYQCKRRLACKITGPARMAYLTSIFPDAVFINIVRDPLPTINSWLNVDFWQDKGKHQLWWTGAYSKKEEEWAAANADKPELLAAMQYRKLQDVTATEIKTNIGQCLTVRYEDFVKNPAITVNTILDFADLKKSKQVEDYLSGINIYDQNKTKTAAHSEDSDKPYMATLKMILDGSYIY